MKNTVVDDNEFLLLPFTKRIGFHDFPTKYARGRAEDISNYIETNLPVSLHALDIALEISKNL